MKPLKNAYDFFTGRRRIIKNNVGGVGMFLIEKIPTIDDPRARTFFHHSIICSITDAYEYFLEIDTSNNIFYKNIYAMTVQAGENFIKWETIYNTLCFINGNSDYDESQKLEEALFYIFDSNGDEQHLYFELKHLLTENESAFMLAFSDVAVAEIFKLKELSKVDTSFIYNFYYNCYTDFYRTYTKYAMISFSI